MTNDTICTFGERRDDVLIGYLYDEIDARDRSAFERHLPGCPPCRHELEALTDVRGSLAEWADPVVTDGIGGQAPRSSLRLVGRTPPARGRWQVLAEAPVWMQAAAAMLVVGASLGLANLNVSYTRDGLTLTTGWVQAATTPAASAPVTATASAQPTAQAAPTDAAPWREELTALEQQLRRELASKPVRTTAAASSSDDEAVMTRVRALLQESERRQQTELALRVAEMARDSQTQRQADLVRIERTLGVLQNRTGVEVMRTQQQLNSLAQRVSQRE